jgi:hypothetical protein
LWPTEPSNSARASAGAAIAQRKRGCFSVMIPFLSWL